ncbi:MAG: hypothetical protein JO246_00915 [Frankiaceae bacterium]|nr:hypothetical protein [Frankiaceae bacterium]
MATEQALFHGYSRTTGADDRRVETRGCACGGRVIADPAAPAKGVSLHNTTGRHKAWREAHGYDLDIQERP